MLEFAIPIGQDIRQVQLAKAAVRIGLLPDIPLERIQSVGNAAASGAQMVLLSRTVRAKAAKLARKIKYIEIAHNPDFATVYTDCMSF